MRYLRHTYFLSVKILVFIFLLTACFTNGTSAQFTPAPIASRNVIDSALTYHEKWRISNLLIKYLGEAIFYTNGDLLVFVSHSPDGLRRWLNVLDAKSSSLLWQTPSLPFPEDSLTLDQQRLYITLSNKVIAYDLFSGELLWETQELLPGRTRYRTYVEDDKLIVYSAEDPATNASRWVVRIYDSRSGFLESIEEDTLSQDASFLLRTSTKGYWTSDMAIWSMDNQTKQQRWSVPLEGSVQHQPLLIGDTLVFTSGVFSKIIGVNDFTGRQIWSYEGKIVSNLAAESEVVYAIREDAAVVAVDVKTGKEIGFIKFTPGTTEVDVRSMSYLVAAAKDMLFMYYGDSRELIAFSK